MTVRRFLFGAAAFALAVMVVPVWSWAQAQPNGMPPPGAAYQPPAPSPLPQPPMPQEFQQSTFPETFNSWTTYPRQEVNAVPPAYVRLVIVRAQLRRAESALNRAVADVRRAFDRSLDWVAAISNERDAWDAYLAARNRALQSVRSDPSYLASVNLKQSIATQIEDLRRDTREVTDAVLAMATVKMGYASTASAMEAAAIAADPEVQGARHRLRLASSKVSELRARFENDVRTSQPVLEARRNLDDLRIAHLAIDANFWATLDARNIALDYAVFLHRYDLYRNLNNSWMGWNGGWTGGAGWGPGVNTVGFPVGWGWNGMRN